jgi:D-sedoheptulose 7-phosphate isomerase
MTSHSQRYLQQAARIAGAVDHEAVERIAAGLAELRARSGRLFLLGVGGSAANCSHAVNDFRKLDGIEAYAPTDNVSEITARTNDEGWDRVFEAWLRTSRAGAADAVFILSVGGGDAQRNISANLVRAIDEAKRRGMKIYGIVGRAESYTKQQGDEVIVVPVEDPSLLTPHAEAFQSVICHAIVCHPSLIVQKMKWEEVQAPDRRA